MTASQQATQPSALVVDDEALLLMLLAETLRDAGFLVHEAGNGEAALAVVEAHPEIALMISDIRMPGMNGYQVANAVLAARPSVKIMLMTGYSEEAVPKDLVENGVKLLLKPLDLDDVATLATNLLGDSAP